MWYFVLFLALFLLLLFGIRNVPLLENTMDLVSSILGTLLILLWYLIFLKWPNWIDVYFSSISVICTKKTPLIFTSNTWTKTAFRWTHLAFQSLEFYRNWWRLCQKCVVRTKLDDIYILFNYEWEFDRDRKRGFNE